MKNKDLKYKLKQIIHEEVRTVISEREYKYGGLLDPENFDPVDPEVHISGYGTMSRSALRREIVRRLEGSLRSAKSAAVGRSGSFEMYKNLSGDLEPNNTLSLLINAEIEVANQLEELRTKGGRRAEPIPKQL